ncbi:MAG: hypothetical protein D8M57_04270 [Candidatus Scalindua sp. AMX11]|nr:MAG: hypothetical protein DWQ00_02165 [Candidatus Scalindua sp.]NOG84665.1 hypothetical protein [Planctomycetota bacterium]RZV92436.1 MAG: hypothetical protein EX341_05160 [Candidatus Scalindua sp. SCAELEC01]TDE66035.1 MAG: hypothetical protein D8M57_04270 [Candidatus Scalindua sp. AMX11]GJQ59006.1 MAG: hypothetical protein SCALA701_18070 [Candidatus Scalindua sp.]
MEEQQGQDTVSPSHEPDQGILDAHRLLVMWLFISTLVIGVSFLALVLYFHWTGRGGVTIGVAVIVAGAGGGFVSSLQRLYGFQDIFPRRQYIRLFRRMNFYVVAYSFVPALVGMIGAIVLYLIFAAGLLKGDLFPEFHCSMVDGCNDFHGFVTNWSPNGPAANAKAIVWGFIAGFSERFVPDILNRLGSERSK